MTWLLTIIIFGADPVQRSFPMESKTHCEQTLATMKLAAGPGQVVAALCEVKK